MKAVESVKTFVKLISYLLEPIQSTQWLGSLKWSKSRTFCIHIVVNPGFGTGGATWLLLSLVQQVATCTSNLLAGIGFVHFWIGLDLTIFLFVTRSEVPFWAPRGALEATSWRFWWADRARNGGTQRAQRLKALDYTSKHPDASVYTAYPTVLQHVKT